MMAGDDDMNVNRTQRGDVDPGQIDLVNRDPNDLNSHVSVSLLPRQLSRKGM